MNLNLGTATGSSLVKVKGHEEGRHGGFVSLQPVAPHKLRNLQLLPPGLRRNHPADGAWVHAGVS